MLTKSSFPITFSQGLDTKTDPFQIAPGRFLTLTNSVFTNGVGLQKRNGFGILTSLPDTTSTFLTTFSGNLTAFGTSVQAFNSASKTWVNKGTFQSVQLDTLSLIRASTNQSYADCVVASNGLACVVYTDQVPSTANPPVNVATYKYAIIDTATGQNITAPTNITPTSGTVTFAPKVFLFNAYFIIVFDTVITATNHLQYIAINSQNTAVVKSATNVTSSYAAASTGTFDCVAMNNRFYFFWAETLNVSQAYIDGSFALTTGLQPFTTDTATILTVCADAPNNVIYLASSNSGSGGDIYITTYDGSLTQTGGSDVIATVVPANLAIVAQNNLATLFYEVPNTYGGTIGSVSSNFIRKLTYTVGGTASAPSTIARSVGLASKPFIISNSIYFLGAYDSTYQPTYFLFDSSGNVLSRLAYQNGGGYLTTGLPNVTVSGTSASIPYLIKDLITSVNKGTALSSTTQTAGIYSQTGVNLVSFDLSSSDLDAVEIGGCVNLTGGFLWQYDGATAVENNFFLYPEGTAAGLIGVSWSASGGSMLAQPDGLTNANAYYYQVCYEWADNNGNVNRSAPSIPTPVTTTGAGTIGSVTLTIPTLRLTYKTNVQIVIYRWSVAQQAYYRVTSLSAPSLSRKTVDTLQFTDTLGDTSIIGNTLIYTTGGVVEDVGTPSFSSIALFQSRLFGIDNEDKNLLWFSKQVIESTPVEMSDLLTNFVAPTTGAQGSTGKMRCLSVMDDKIIIFKQDAIYYVNGQGPDNTGGNNQYSEPVLISSTVGSLNKKSIVLMPNGIMFQSDKGIWLLGRDLNTSYIGAPVEAYNSSTVISALTIPGTNQVRFTLDSGIILMYDYFYNQWGTFNPPAGISSTLYNLKHAYLAADGKVYQETPGLYLDGYSPVVMSFTTGWMNLMGLQGYERAYFFYILGSYISPHKLNLSIAYDYAPTAEQTVLISPDNYNPAFGSDGGFFGNPGPMGGTPSLEQWRVFFSKQKCQSFQISMQEMYDSSKGVAAGQGLTLSGLNLVVGSKKGYKPQSAKYSAG